MPPPTPTLRSGPILPGMHGARDPVPAPRRMPITGRNFANTSFVEQTDYLVERGLLTIDPPLNSSAFGFLMTPTYIDWHRRLRNDCIRASQARIQARRDAEGQGGGGAVL